VSHPWHDIDVSPEDVEDNLPVVIEIPAGSKNKYELHKPSGYLKLDRVLHSAVRYPANYGFIPQSYCDDDDPLDVMVIGQEAVVPMTIMYVRPVGVMHMRDQGRLDDKIIAVSVFDPLYSHMMDLGQLPPHLLTEIRRFFLDYKVLEEKEVEIEPFEGRGPALAVIRQALADYVKARDTLPGVWT
jgi:inorganic pyrophosphatase